MVMFARYEPYTQQVSALLMRNVTGISTEPVLPEKSEVSMTAEMLAAVSELNCSLEPMTVTCKLLEVMVQS